jgi:hypothetical protein
MYIYCVRWSHFRDMLIHKGTGLMTHRRDLTYNLLKALNDTDPLIILFHYHKMRWHTNNFPNIALNL